MSFRNASSTLQQNAMCLTALHPPALLQHATVEQKQAHMSAPSSQAVTVGTPLVSTTLPCTTEHLLFRLLLIKHSHVSAKLPCSDRGHSACVHHPSIRIRSQSLFKAEPGLAAAQQGGAQHGVDIHWVGLRQAQHGRTEVRKMKMARKGAQHGVDINASACCKQIRSFAQQDVQATSATATAQQCAEQAPLMQTQQWDPTPLQQVHPIPHLHAVRCRQDVEIDLLLDP